MKRLTLLLVLLMVVAFSATLFAQQLAILKPAKMGQKSEAIPITKKQYEKMMQKSRSMIQIPEIKATHAGIIDTLSNPFPTSVNWGIAAGDSQAAYFDPPAACYIKAIGIVGQSWGSEALSDGYNLIINKAAYGWDFPEDWWDGDAIYTKEHGLPTLLGDLMWGEFPNTVVDGERVWTEMIWLGAEPDNGGEGFVVTAIPYGGSYMGTDAGSAISPDITDDTYRLAKYYQGGRSGHDPQFTVRHYTLTWQVVVEFYQNTPPSIEVVGGPYATVLTADARTIKAHIWDIDANDPNQAGVASANLVYKVNDGEWNTVAMTLASGDDKDGVWEGVVPAGIMSPGDVLTYKFTATDKAGASSEIFGGSYGYFKKFNEILVFYNDDGSSYPSWILHPYYDNLWAKDETPYGYDVWVGAEDGPLSATLIDQYDYIVQIDAYSPATLNDDVLGPWFASGTKYMFWSSQEWAGAFVGGWGAEDDTTFAADDWHNMYMGIEYAGGPGHDIASDPFRINPVQGDIISGPLFDFLGDSLGLYINTSYELGWTNWSDAITPASHAVVCFTDSAQGRAMGIHTENNGTKTVFLTFDQLCMDTQALPSYTATDGYHWTEPNVHSVVDAALDWFGAPTDVNDAVEPAVALKYELSQNYPNPFNPETRISYTIAKPGHVKLAIYNVLGQKVATLVDEYKAASTYRVTFNANNLPSGVYFYRLEVGDYSKTMKMMLLR